MCGWWILVQSWGDAVQRPPLSATLECQNHCRHTVSISHSKTIGADRDLAARPIDIYACCTLAWVSTGWTILLELAPFPRDYCLNQIRWLSQGGLRIQHGSRRAKSHPQRGSSHHTLAENWQFAPSWSIARTTLWGKTRPYYSWTRLCKHSQLRQQNALLLVIVWPAKSAISQHTLWARCWLCSSCKWAQKTNRLSTLMLSHSSGLRQTSGSMRTVHEHVSLSGKKEVRTPHVLGACFSSPRSRLRQV